MSDKLIVWVHLGNKGASPATLGATLELTGIAGGQVKTMKSIQVPEALEPGAYTDAVTFELPGQPLDSIEIKVKSKELECDTNNNTVVLPGPFCNG